MNDQSATETKKDDIISDRKDKAYEDKLDEWKDKKKVTINKDAWNSIKTDKNEVFQRMETEENSSDSDDSAGTTVANSDDSDTSVSPQTLTVKTLTSPIPAILATHRKMIQIITVQTQKTLKQRRKNNEGR